MKLTPPRRRFGLDTLLATKSWTSFSVSFVPGFLTTNATGNSPVASFGRPTTAASVILGWVMRIASSSAGATYDIQSIR